MSPKVQRIAGWVLSGLIAAFLIVASGVPKLMGGEFMDKLNAEFGFSSDTMKVIGGIEIIIALLFVIPRAGFLAAILITGYLGGAIVTHVRIGEAPVFPIVLGVLVWVALALRSPVIWRLAVGANPTPPPPAA
jgi:DoxX-like family